MEVDNACMWKILCSKLISICQDMSIHIIAAYGQQRTHQTQPVPLRPAKVTVWFGVGTKVYTLPLNSLAFYWSGPNNRSLWFFLNAPVPDDSSKHIDSLFSTSPFLLLKKPVTVLEGVSLLSQTCFVNGYTI
ncbi:hypothetical protein TNCV_429301 [Trichonephila clavipes]|nr:hypothetical protein TNCV_429301 [Trichonephila clavipes]